MTKRVAVLGAGIMGACLALHLARRQFDVVLFDAAPAPLQGASRWNEGKIHLGYLYANDASLDTARRLLPGGLAFAPLMRDLIGPLPDVTADDDIYLVHRRSIAAAPAMAAHFDAVAAMTRAFPNAGDYLADVSASRPRALGRDEIAAFANPDQIVAAFSAPERSIATAPLADRLAAALAATPRNEMRMNTRIDRVARDDSAEFRCVEGERFDWVVNALWHGRVAVDATADLAPAPGWSHRYRVSAFVRTARPLQLPIALVALGPFGDVKNYTGRDFYLSWYPAGLLSESHALAPAPPPVLDAAARQTIAARICEALARLIPGVRDVFASAERIDIEGGYVFAQGRGSLADPASTLHARSAFGVRRRGRYISIDTGKYSTAPLMALELSNQLAGD
jgi:glycine/D-amino acid oxidase-like deaminating enzyme